MIPYIFFSLYVICITYLYLSKDKKHILLFNIGACMSCSVYLYAEGTYAGVIACFAASGGSLFQLYMMHYAKEHSETYVNILKFAGCSAFASIGIYTVYDAPPDILLIIAIIACRGGETLSKSLHVKMGFTLAEGLWLIYAAYNELFLLFSIHLIMTLLGLYSILKNSREQSLYIG